VNKVYQQYSAAE